jgi:hypothetical protein
MERGPGRPELAPYYDWSDGPDSGISSKTLVQVITGASLGVRQPSMPLDPGDFGRCYRVLQRFPELRSQLGKVAEAYPEWRLLVQAWDELERVYEEELLTGEYAPRLYARMGELRAQGEAQQRVE